jgi:hypothetical protein
MILTNITTPPVFILLHISQQHPFFPTYTTSQQRQHQFPAPKTRTGHVLIAEVLVGSLGQRGLCAVYGLAQHVKHLQ